MNPLSELWQWLSDAANWSGSAGIPTRVVEHIQISGLAVVLALVVALPMGLFIGHTRRAEFVTITAANLGRAIPSFAVLALAFPLALQFDLGFSILPIVAALFLLAIPPILTNTYVGVKGVDRDTLEAARGMGMSGGQLLRSIELPLAAPLIVAGIRTSTVQVVATATLGALIAGGGLGRYIIDGFSQQNDGMYLGGALLVALLALLTELGFTLVERIARPRTRSPEPSLGFEPAAQVGQPSGGAL
ncbi:MAG: ABC transporter permease [Actinomycetota bacterium]